MVKKPIYPWNKLSDDAYWTLGGLYPNRKIKWVKRNKIPQWYIDLLNGKKVKMAIKIDDWKFRIGSAK